MQLTTFQDYTQLQPKGLITIPKKFRLSLGMEEKQLLRLTKEKSRLIIEPVQVLSYPVRRYTKQDLKDFFKLDANDSKSLKTKNLL